MLSKKQQTKSNRLKPTAHKEPEYMKWLHEVKQPCCFVCGTMLGIQIHHVKRHSNDLRNDNEVIPLCVNHHTGVEFSPHGTPNDWREVYSMTDQLEVAKELYEEYKS